MPASIPRDYGRSNTNGNFAHFLKVLRVFAEFRETFSESRALMPQVLEEIQLELQHFYFVL